jgi:Fe2+ transport system protein FeoA
VRRWTHRLDSVLLHPIAIRVGRMTVAIRRKHAGAIRVVALSQ